MAITVWVFRETDVFRVTWHVLRCDIIANLSAEMGSHLPCSYMAV
jgi:hypothetical protein